MENGKISISVGDWILFLKDKSRTEIKAKLDAGHSLNYLIDFDTKLKEIRRRVKEVAHWVKCIEHKYVFSFFFCRLIGPTTHFLF